jgi:hypothetical protein
MAAATTLPAGITQAEHVLVGRAVLLTPPVEEATRVPRGVVRHGPGVRKALVNPAQQATTETAEATSDAAKAAADATKTAADAAKAAFDAAKATADSLKSMADAARLAAGITEDEHRANTVAASLGQIIGLAAIVLVVVAVATLFAFMFARKRNDRLAKGGKKPAARVVVAREPQSFVQSRRAGPVEGVAGARTSHESRRTPNGLEPSERNGPPETPSTGSVLDVEREVVGEPGSSVNQTDDSQATDPAKIRTLAEPTGSRDKDVHSSVRGTAHPVVGDCSSEASTGADERSSAAGVSRGRRRFRMVRHGVWLVALGALAALSAYVYTRPRKLGAPEEQRILSLPKDRAFVHQKASEQGNTVALWVRRPKSIDLFVTGRPPVGFKGYVGFDKGVAFHVVQPLDEEGALMIAGPNAENDAWLVWGPESGIEGEPLDNYLAFDHKGNHVIYALYDHGQWSWVMDDKPLAGSHRLNRVPVTSEGGETIAWIDGGQGAARVVINGEAGPTYDDILGPSLHLSPDGKHHFYIAYRSGRLLAIQDGKEHSEYEKLGSPPTFSADGVRVAYAATKGPDRSCVVLDGTEGGEYDAVEALTFSPDSLRFAHRATKGGRSFFVVDGQEQNSQFDGLANAFVFAPRGRRFAYAGFRGKTWSVVVDGQEGKGCARVFGMTFSPDGQHFAKGEVGDDGKLHVFVDGGERWAHEGKPVVRPSFSPDGTRLLYVISRSSQVFVVVDGVEGPGYSATGGSTFSPDSKHFVYFATTDGQKYAVYLDGQVQHQFDSIPSLLSFTPGGQLFYCGVQRGIKANEWYMVVDGVLSGPYDRIYLPPSGLVPLQPDGTLAYVALEGDDVVRVRQRPTWR